MWQTDKSAAKRAKGRANVFAELDEAWMLNEIMESSTSSQPKQSRAASKLLTQSEELLLGDMCDADKCKWED